MTISDFENQINPTILQRGRSYFNDGLVDNLEENNNTWTAEVYGSEDYSVEVTLSERGEIREYFCDCPYDGVLCKHVAAVCYAIRKEKMRQPMAKQSAGTKKKTFDDLLNSISPDEYKNFIRQHAAQDKNFKLQFELFFSDKDDRIDIEQKYSDLIRKFARKYSDRGYYDYRSARSLSKEIDGLTGKGREMIARNNFRDAFLLGKTLLKEVMAIYPDCDDSNGDLGSTIEEAIGLFETLSDADDAAIVLKQQMFDFLKAELENQEYFNYGDFGYHLFSVFHNLALQLRQTKDFVDFIDIQCEKLTGKYDNYRKEFLLKEKIAFYHETGHAQTNALVKQSMDIVEIRKAEVDKSINRQDYAEAKRLIAEGVKIAEEKGHPGTVNQWKKELLRIAGLKNDTEAIRQLTRYFAFDHGFNKEYYHQWRQTYSETEWKEIIEQLIADRTNEIIREHGPRKNIWNHSPNLSLLHSLSPIYIEEQYWDRLMALVQAENHLDILLRYHEYLTHRYPKEMLALYLPEFRRIGSRVNSRNEYADLAKKMIRVLKDIPDGKEQIQAIASELIAQNPRRPAMIEELKKVLVV